MKGVKYSAKEKQRALTMWLVDKVDILKVAKRFKCTERSLWRWKARYDGTLDSLQNVKPQPHHPSSHTEEERMAIEEIFCEYPDIGYSEALGILRTKYAYSRTYFGFYRYVVKNNLRPQQEYERRENLPYDTPEMYGVKMQMDVKYVPRECYVGEAKKMLLESNTRYYQYTIIDEATRERFIYPYTEQSARATVDFVKRAIAYFGYIPACIQTDNGCEFTNPKGQQCKKVHALDELLDSLGVRHQLIRAYTPRHNGKVERSHRSDQEGFYKYLKVSCFEELYQPMADWLIRYNNRPHSSLKDKHGKRRWWSPIQKRQELAEMIENGEIEPTSLFVATVAV